MSREIAAILLAAGSSQRFGGDKLLYPLPDGTPMAVAAAISLRAACCDTVAVLRPHNDALARVLAAEGCQIIPCADAERGMGHSLAAGVRARSDAAAWVVALADMPFITADSHHAVVARLRMGASLAACAYRQRRGHPVGFSKIWLDALTALTGDQGARTLLDAHCQELVLCHVEDPGVVRDIDRREDLPDKSG